MFGQWYACVFARSCCKAVLDVYGKLRKTVDSDIDY